MWIARPSTRPAPQGWCPAGRWAEDGPIPAHYPLRETSTPDPAERTRLNVRDSDATLVLTLGPPHGGTALTLELARALGRPHQLVDLRAAPSPEALADWIRQLEVRVLNVAGPRESEAAGSYRIALELVADMLDYLMPLASRTRGSRSSKRGVIPRVHDDG